jgi:hypothetical protein
LRVEDGPRVPVAPEVSSAADLYAVHFAHARHERMFIASIRFFVALALVRTITHLIRARRGPFHDVATKGGHLHHLVWAILLLLAVGYLWLIQVGSGGVDGRPWNRIQPTPLARGDQF